MTLFYWIELDVRIKFFLDADNVYLMFDVIIGLCLVSDIGILNCIYFFSSEKSVYENKDPG